MAIYNRFHCFVVDLGLGVHNLDKDPLSIYLSNDQPKNSDCFKEDVKEISTGNGYQGAVDVASTYSGSDGTGLLTVNEHEFKAADGSVGPFRYVVLFNAKPAKKPLVAYWDYGSEVTLNDGERFKFSPAAPIWTIS